MAIRAFSRNLLPCYRGTALVAIPRAFVFPNALSTIQRYASLSKTSSNLHELVLRYAFLPEATDVIKAALEKNDERNVLNKDGKTALEVAAKLGDTQLFKVLRDWRKNDVIYTSTDTIPFSRESMFATSSNTASFALTILYKPFDALAVIPHTPKALVVTTPKV